MLTTMQFIMLACHGQGCGGMAMRCKPSLEGFVAHMDALMTQ